MAASLEGLLKEVPVPTPVTTEATPPNLAAARACVAWMSGAIFRLNRAVGVEAWTSVLVQDLVLSSASQAAVFWRHGWSDHARKSLLHSWIDQSLVFEPGWTQLCEHRDRLVSDQLGPTGIRLEGSERDREFLLVFGLAVAEKLGADQAESHARQSLRQLISRLALSIEDMAQLLGVPADAVEQWESGRVAIPMDAQALLGRANHALSRLLATFRPERLPELIRREVDLFDGRSAYDWIRQGRIEEVADRYDAAFAYQG